MKKCNPRNRPATQADVERARREARKAEREVSVLSINLSKIFSKITYDGLDYVFRLEKEYKEWLGTTNCEKTDFQRFLYEKHLEDDREYREKYGYEPPASKWDL